MRHFMKNNSQSFSRVYAGPAIPRSNDQTNPPCECQDAETDPKPDITQNDETSQLYPFNHAAKDEDGKVSALTAEKEASVSNETDEQKTQKQTIFGNFKLCPGDPKSRHNTEMRCVYAGPAYFAQNKPPQNKKDPE